MIGLVAGAARRRGSRSSRCAGSSAERSAGRAAALGTCLALASPAFAARLAAGARVPRRASRAPERARATPLWQRLYLDLLALAVSGLVYWLTARTGFSAVVNPDSNPTLSLSVYMFLAPALLWIGATLLLVRLRGRAPSRARAGGRAATTARTCSPAPPGAAAAINRGLVLVGLLLAFAVELGDLHGDLEPAGAGRRPADPRRRRRRPAPPGARSAVGGTIAAVPGVAATTALDHTYAYVGPDLQDTFGDRPGDDPPRRRRSATRTSSAARARQMLGAA